MYCLYWPDRRKMERRSAAVSFAFGAITMSSGPFLRRALFKPCIGYSRWKRARELNQTLVPREALHSFACRGVIVSSTHDRMPCARPFRTFWGAWRAFSLRSAVVSAQHGHPPVVATAIAARGTGGQCEYREQRGSWLMRRCRHGWSPSFCARRLRSCQHAPSCRSSTPARPSCPLHLRLRACVSFWSRAALR